MTDDYPPIGALRSYPATGCTPQRMYTQAELDAAIAADRAKRKPMTETQIVEFGSLLIMNRRAKKTVRGFLSEYKAERGIE
jgi:hypothetical protein